jgi:hypothetical protein
MSVDFRQDPHRRKRVQPLAFSPPAFSVAFLVLKPYGML